VEVVSTVGAGDSTLAGYLLGAVRGLAPADRLALAVAHGTTAVTLPGTTLPTPTDLPTTLPVPVRVPQSPED
jgi:1-phosphofructokinase